MLRVKDYKVVKKVINISEGKQQIMKQKEFIINHR